MMIMQHFLNISGDRTFDEFESYILEFKRVCHMDGTVGRLVLLRIRFFIF